MKEWLQLTSESYGHWSLFPRQLKANNVKISVLVIQAKVIISSRSCEYTPGEKQYHQQLQKNTDNQKKKERKYGQTHSWFF